MRGLILLFFYETTLGSYRSIFIYNRIFNVLHVYFVIDTNILHKQHD